MKFRKLFATLIVVSFLALITGCTTLPSAETMKSEVANFQLPKLPDDNKGLVYVVRPSSLGGFVKFNVFIDNQEDASEVGHTRGTEFIYFSISPGSRTIDSKAENWAEAKIVVQPGDIIFLQQDASMVIIMARHSIYKIDADQGKYLVKTLTLGTIK